VDHIKGQRSIGPRRQDVAGALAFCPPEEWIAVNDRVWTLSTASLMAAVDAGRSPRELAAFLDERAVHGIPSTVRGLLTDVEGWPGRSAIWACSASSNALTRRWPPCSPETAPCAASAAASANGI
jgi:hypothetical protein